MTARSRGETLPAGAAFVAGDVASASGVKAIAAGVLEALGGLDILVNNAGGASGFPQGTASIPDEAWQAGFALNLFAYEDSAWATLTLIARCGSAWKSCGRTGSRDRPTVGTRSYPIRSDQLSDVTEMEKVR